jgi:hypothetical protein
MINSNGNVDWGNDIAFAKNLTLAVSRAQERERRRSGRCWASAPVPGSALVRPGRATRSHM